VANIMETQVKHEVEDSIDTSSTTPNTSQTELEINEESTRRKSLTNFIT
jgi:hypothetical protein